MAKPVEVRNLTKNFRHPMKVWDKIEAVKDFSFSVETGEIVGFVGHNGAGKTTTIKMMMGFIAPTSGEISIFGQNAGSIEVKKKVGFLPERPYFYSELTSMELLKYFGKLSGMKGSSLIDKAEKVLRRVGLYNDRNRKLSGYSKGMLQRIGIAQSIIHDPELVIMDEPMSGLDPIGRREVKEIIRSLKREGRSVIFSSHILSDIENLSDRVLIIEKGVRKSFGTVREIVRPENIRFSIEFGGPDEMKDAAFSLFKGIRVSSDRFIIDCQDLADFNSKLAVIVQKGYTVHDAKGVYPSLEEIVFKGSSEAGHE
ncbi:MAG TPA: ABC transporter ATP-binding protein [bacterium]|nr:ABC transporter ATP-binding protein [bacterium]